jgi:SAM-dependent methyltransferase
VPTDEFTATNRRNWDERVAIHRRDETGFYAMERFLAGEKQLQAIDNGELGDVTGKRVIHLQCHFGIDTLIMARNGAIVTGIDFSPAAITEAKALATQTGLSADFMCANVYDARAAAGGEFDIVYTTWGTICWLPDIPRWARVVASLLAPGGFLYFADAHPNMLILEQRDGRLVPEFPIDTPPDEPLVFNETKTYTGDSTPLKTTCTYEWIHSLSRIVGALIEAGLALEFLHEHPTLPWPPFPMCVPTGKGGYQLPDEIPAFPLAVSLRARK